MLKRLIRNIRSKPKMVRDNVALGVAGFFTVLVAILWLQHVPDRIVAVSPEVAGENYKEEASFGGLFSKIGEQVASIKGSFSDVIEKQKATEEGSVEIQEGSIIVSSTTGFIFASTTAEVAETAEKERRIVHIMTVPGTTTSTSSTTKTP